jgi:hypothetical protein
MRNARHLVVIAVWLAAAAIAGGDGARFSRPAPAGTSDPRRPIVSAGDVHESVPAEGIERAGRFHAHLIERIEQPTEALVAGNKGTAYYAARSACTW